MTKNKTVYILGAGFSKPAKAPVQSEIINEIFLLDPIELDSRYKDIFIKNRDAFKEHLTNTMYIQESKLGDVQLEDVYTPIDRCIIDNQSFRNIAPEKLMNIRDQINSLIIILYDHKLRNISNVYIDDFAKYLVEKRASKIKSDPYAIISTNWDILLDNALNIKKTNGVIDYCMHCAPYNKHQNLMPGLLAKGKGMYNIKILKLHGSMNWLHCQRCQRVYVSFNEKNVIDEFIDHPKCRLCQHNFKNTNTGDGGAILVSNLIMPTFLKDLSIVQLKLVWQNAGIELSEAGKIVFMGYSFPAADYELRHLFAKFIPHDTKIEVVLKGKIDKTRPEYEFSPEFRYRSFFGKRNINFSFDGVESYISKLCEASELPPF